jgi:DNA-binding MarR family transcriptional regulator
MMNDLQETPWSNPRFRNWVALIRAHKAVGRALGKALAPLDLKIVQLDLLMNVHRHPGISQQDVARRLLVGRSNVTMLLPELERKKLMTRAADEKDKRIQRLTVTDKGEKVLAEALKVYSALIERVMGQSSDEECNTIGASMNRITAMLENDPA